MPEIAYRPLGLTLRGVDAEKRTVDVLASTDAIDSYDEIVEQTWVLDRFIANPVILWAHSSRELPIGRAENVRVTDKGLECTICFASAEANPRAEQVLQLFKEKVLRAVSVGFYPRDVRFEKRDDREVAVLGQNELYEISVTPVPANPEALARMRARAIAETTTARAPAPPPNDGAPSAPEDRTMPTIEELLAKVTERDATISRHATELATAIAARDVAMTERDTAQTRVTELEATNATLTAKTIGLEVDALVGVKILPAEREEFVELAASNRPLFEKMLAKKPALKVLGPSVLAPTPGATENEIATADSAPDADLVARDIKKLAAELPAFG